LEFATKNRLPGIYPLREYVKDGGVMSYGAKLSDLYRYAATYVDKILKGAKPADLPVEQPTKFELTINVKAAKQIGLTIPPSVLGGADQVIKIGVTMAELQKAKHVSLQEPMLVTLADDRCTHEVVDRERRHH
jgi:ABC transporter substrate binding protein